MSFRPLTPLTERKRSHVDTFLCKPLCVHRFLLFNYKFLCSLHRGRVGGHLKIILFFRIKFSVNILWLQPKAWNSLNILYTILYPLSCIHYPVSTILYPLSCIHYPVSTILYRLPCIHYPVSTILYPLSCIYYPVSTILFPLSCIHYPVSTILYPLSCIHYPVSTILYIHHPVSTILYPLSCIQYPSMFVKRFVSPWFRWS